MPQDLQARRRNLQKASARLEQQLERLTDAYLGGVLSLEEYRRRPEDLEQQRESLLEQERQFGLSVDRQIGVRTLVTTIEPFVRASGQGWSTRRSSSNVNSLNASWTAWL